VLAGSSKGLSYGAGECGMEMFNETLIEPTAYSYFVETGNFRDGTMLALILHDSSHDRRGVIGAGQRGALSLPSKPPRGKLRYSLLARRRPPRNLRQS
jgi:hypothetical protein